MTNIVEARSTLGSAQLAKSDAERRLSEAERTFERLCEKLKEELGVGRNIPCRVRILDAEHVAVVVYRETENRRSTELHIVTPE